MSKFKSIVLATVVLTAVVLTQSASALLVLPDSTYAEAEGNWQGSKEYTEDGYLALIEFAVYDTEGTLAAEEQALVDQMGMSNRYIYAYQIFNHRDATKDLESFSVFGIDVPLVEAVIADIGSYDDGDEGIAAESGEFDSDIPGVVWNFAWNDTIGALEQSQFLAFSSDNAPVAGDFSLSQAEYDDTPPAPGDEVPEPASILLLICGGLCSIRSKRDRA